MINLSAEIIANGATYEIRNLSSIEFSGQDRGDPSLPSWGIQSNSGSLEMYDADGTIITLKKQGILANSKINIYLNIGNRKEQIGVFYIVDADKKQQGLLTKLDYKDILDSWQNIPMKQYYNPYSDNTIYLKNILNIITESSGTTLKFSNAASQQRLEQILIQYPILYEGSLWSQMTKICEASSCYIYCDNEGTPTIYYSGDT